MLTDQEIRNAKPGVKSYKLADGRGLTLLVTPNGSELWRFRYRSRGGRKCSVSASIPTRLRSARDKRDDARKLLAQGIDPSDQRQAEKKNARGNTFEVVAREWLVLQKKLAATTYANAVWTLETLIFPFIGDRPIDKIKPIDVLNLLRRIEGRGLHETAHRARQRCSQVFRYGVITERCERDVTADLRGAHAPVVTTHHPSITEPSKIGQLLRDIESYRGNASTWYALRLTPHLFVRPGELRIVPSKEHRDPPLAGISTSQPFANIRQSHRAGPREVVYEISG